MSGLDVVVFENVKPYFVINEDLTVVYAVDKKVRTSTRDWIGLFRKGWTKPEELIVFEWASGHFSEETLPRRTITFCSKDFSGRINPNDQYQFAYISRVHEVLGRSQFFLFITDAIHQRHCRYLSENISSMESDDEDSDWLHVSQINSSTTHTLRVAPAPSVVDTLAHPDLPPNYHHKKTAGKKCATCSCPSDYMIANSRLTEKVVSQAEQIRSLQAKLTALRSDLELCHVSQQQLKIKADMACREKENYCSFIGQFLESLKRKGQLKIVDSEGNTIMVKNVSPQVKDGQTTTRKQSFVTSVGVPQCPQASLNTAGNVQQHLRHELATELRQVCRKYCEETESVEVRSTDITAEDTVGQLHSSAPVKVTNNESNKDDPGQLICADASGENMMNGNLHD